MRPDVVWLVHEVDNEPLRYSIRSVVEHAAGQFGQLWVVGQMPEWLTGVGHVPAVEPEPREKFTSIRAKIDAVARDERVAPRVVVLNDDMYAVRPVRSWEPTHLGTTSHYLATGDYRPKNTWWRALKATAEWVGGDPLCYAGHVPLLYDRARLRDALDRYPADRPLLDCGLYPVAGAGGEGAWALNAKIGPDDYARFDDARMPGWWSSNDASWVGELGRRVRVMFPKSCPHEA